MRGELSYLAATACPPRMTYPDHPPICPDLPFDCLAVGQEFAVDMPRDQVMLEVRAFLRDHPHKGFALACEGGLTTCFRVA